MPKDELKILPVRIDESRLGEIDCGDILPRIPHLIIAVGHVRSGKSTIYNSLYLRPEFYGDKFDVKILLSPTAHQDEVNKHLVEIFDFVIDDVDDNVIEELIKMIQNDTSDQKYIMVFDDVVGTLEQKKNGKPDILTKLSTKYRHIGGASGEGKLSICICTQFFKFLTPTLRLNASGYLLCGNSAECELKGMAENLSTFGGSEKRFKELYKESKKKPFDFLFLNVQKGTAYRNFETLLYKSDN